MEKIIQMLAERDGFTRAEAKQIAEECREEMMTALECGDTEAAEEIFQDYTGLEIDYIVDFILALNSNEDTIKKRFEKGEINFDNPIQRGSMWKKISSIETDI